MWDPRHVGPPSCGTPVMWDPPLLTPIPVGGPFHRIGNDILQLPVTKCGHKYAVVFMDYLTKWPEVFPVRDQTAPTIAQLLVEKIITRHSVPAEVLSDRGANFLPGLMLAVHEAMWIHRANTTAYHPQTDGVVEHFNSVSGISVCHCVVRLSL